MFYPILHIDLTSDIPAYRQIVDGLRVLLVAGDLTPGLPLPPVRQLAADLTVHHNTVAQAYRILASEGWLDLRQGSGAVVRHYQPPSATPADEDWLLRRLQELLVRGLSLGITQNRLQQLFQNALHQNPKHSYNKEPQNE